MTLNCFLGFSACRFVRGAIRKRNGDKPKLFKSIFYWLDIERTHCSLKSGKIFISYFMIDMLSDSRDNNFEAGLYKNCSAHERCLGDSK